MSYESLNGEEIDGNLLYYFSTECGKKNNIMKQFITLMLNNLSRFLVDSEIEMLSNIKNSVETCTGLISVEENNRLEQIDKAISQGRIGFSEGNALTLQIVTRSEIYIQVNAFFTALFQRNRDSFNNFINESRKILERMYGKRRSIDLDFYPAM